MDYLDDFDMTHAGRDEDEDQVYGDYEGHISSRESKIPYSHSPEPTQEDEIRYIVVSLADGLVFAVRQDIDPRIVKMLENGFTTDDIFNDWTARGFVVEAGQRVGGPMHEDAVIINIPHRE